MALPNKEELLARASVKPEKVMDPREYPLGYAESLIVECPRILPDHIYAEATEKMHNPFTPTYAPAVLDWWAEKMEKENLYEFARVLADAYLELHNIKRLENIPAIYSRNDWVDWVTFVLKGR